MSEMRFENINPTFATDLVAELKGDVLDGVETEMKNRVPVKTGHLRSSIHRRGDSVVADASYAADVDRRKPFVDDSIEATLDRVGNS